MNKTLIAPSVLSADFLHLEKDIQMLNDNADLIHLDVMDGTFVPNISFGFPVAEPMLKIATIPVDAHLMIVHPEKYVERFAKIGCKMISFHLEAVDDPSPILAQIHSCGVKAGLVVNPDIPVEGLFPHLKECDFILIMSVFAGFGGQKFIETTYDKVAALKAEMDRQGLDIPIEVDGGVDLGNIARLKKVGASIFVAGSAVFKAQNPALMISQLRSCDK